MRTVLNIHRSYSATGGPSRWIRRDPVELVTPQRTRASFVTVTVEIFHCAWCGERFAPTTGPGRPRRYCRRSHRQRHYEARQDAVRHRLRSDDVLIRSGDLQELRDRLYVLESALIDARTDLADAGTIDAYPEVFTHLVGAIEHAVSLRVEPRAVGQDPRRSAKDP